MNTIFTSNEINYIKNRGNNVELVTQQFLHYQTGFKFIQLDRIATIGDGIKQVSKTEKETLRSYYQKIAANKKIAKFVPASGAATRMFKSMYEAIQQPNDEKNRQFSLNLLNSLSKFAFYHSLHEILKKEGISLEEELEKKNFPLIFNYILDKKGLNYGNLPKGALLFHQYSDFCRTAFEEHLVEAAQYATSANNECHIHFTISQDHQELFSELAHKVTPLYEQKYGVIYKISFSYQAHSTDTLAAKPDNTPYHDKNGDLLFRPAGHGALINNLNELDYDLIFVKNIDNVITEEKITPTVEYKQIIAGYLLSLQEKNFQYLDFLTKNSHIETSKLEEITQFAKKELGIHFSSKNPAQDELIFQLNRPMRVCGVVKNEGEPGGGPFWVKNQNGETSCQIVETNQIDKNDTTQIGILKQSTHFNPVDMVCSTKDFNGNPFHLKEFIDPNTSFISEKSQGSDTIKVMELPGLWNGAMAKWITLFVEVPLATFNPVKTIMDLLKQ